jgi:hypothetical protein
MLGAQNVNGLSQKQIKVQKIMCTCWVHKMLMDYHKNKWMGSTLKFLMRYMQEGDEILDSVVTGDET